MKLTQLFMVKKTFFKEAKPRLPSVNVAVGRVLFVNVLITAHAVDGVSLSSHSYRPPTERKEGRRPSAPYWLLLDCVFTGLLYQRYLTFRLQ